MASRMGDVAVEIWTRSVEEWGPEQGVTVIGRDSSLVEVLRKVPKIASFSEPVLIVGESGAGKESLAQALYLLGDRRGRPFVSVNCPQYQEGNLTVSELFGHRRGSFTGATADRKGCFETADGGVIFLDEVGDLHMSAQVMLLRALSAGEFQPLGSDTKRRVNVRVVAATNSLLGVEAVGDHFRNDLFFRLRYFQLKVPPLRERGDDWLLLVDHLLEDLARRYGVEKRLSRPALDLLSGYNWPGNVRELKSVITMGYAMAEDAVIEPDAFEALLLGRGHTTQGPDLYHRVVTEEHDFWDAVHGPFMRRDLNRAQVQDLIRRGLASCGGSYRRLVERLRLEPTDYQRFMDFLRHHDLKP
jgi:DNA-binding NtrC family response regulator